MKTPTEEQVLELCRKLRPRFDSMEYHEQTYWMIEARTRLAAVQRARDMLDAGINIQTTGEATNAIVAGIIRSLLDHIDELEADLKAAIAVGRLAARQSTAQSQ